MQKRILLANKINEEISLSKELFNAFLQINRDEFSLINNSSSLDPLPLIANQWLSSPITIATMLNELDLNRVDSVLEIGCGTGYQAAILSKLVRRVFTIERIKKLYDKAKEHFNNLGLNNICIKYDDGSSGWDKFAPFDRIIISAATTTINQKLFDQLNNNGILIAPIQNKDKQFITKFKKIDNKIEKEVIKECVFVPLLSGIE